MVFPLRPQSQNCNQSHSLTHLGGLAGLTKSYPPMCTERSSAASSESLGIARVTKSEMYQQLIQGNHSDLSKTQCAVINHDILWILSYSSVFSKSGLIKDRNAYIDFSNMRQHNSLKCLIRRSFTFGSSKFPSIDFIKYTDV